MAQQDFLSNHHVVSGLYPVADVFAGGVETDIISMANYRRATFIVMTGAYEDTSVSNVVTVDACDDVSASNTTAVAFKWRVCASSTTVDTWSALTAAAAAGYNFSTNNTAANAIWMIEVDAADIEAAQAGYKFIRLAIAETANKTITGGCICVLSDPRYPVSIPVQAIA